MVGGRRCLLAAGMLAAALGSASAAVVPVSRQAAGSRPAAQTAAPAPLPAQAGERRIQRGDSIRIVVEEEEDLTRTATVSATGTVSLGFMGDAQVAGLTASEAAEAIRKVLLRYIRRPVVSVTLGDSRFSVMGAVQRPGQYVMPGDQIPLLDALAQAGGPVDKANLRSVLLIRQTPEGPVKTRVDVYEAIKGQTVAGLPMVQSGDTLIVDRRADSLGSKILTAAGALASLAWILR